MSELGASRGARRGPIGARVWLVSFVVWSAVGAFSLAPTAAARAWNGRAGLSMPPVLLTLESVWLWAVMTPAILALCLRLPLDRARRWRSLGGHAAAALGLAIADVVIDTPFVGWLAPRGLPLVPRFFQEAFINVFSYAATAGICYALAYGRQLADQRARDAVLEAELLRARLDAVAARLHPHFLFNALHSVAALIRTGERSAAVKAVVALSALLRAALDSDGEAQVPLARELDWIRHYLDIEQIRFQDRLEVELAVADDVDRALVPALVLQPLVENAIRHGVGARTGSGRVVITAWRDGDQLCLDVQDASTEDAGAEVGAPVTDTAGTGLGLRATRERLAHLFGTAYSLELESTKLGSHARVALPFRAEATVAGAAASGAAASGAAASGAAAIGAGA